VNFSPLAVAFDLSQGFGQCIGTFAVKGELQDFHFVVSDAPVAKRAMRMPVIRG
jgi:hypothetical protein